jgi:hypothetical protein
MQKRANTVQDNRRQGPRVGMIENVSVEIAPATIVGPGENISAQGLYFVGDALIPVTVRINGVSEPVRGELVRVQSMGDGRLGIAVRFLEMTPGLE